MKTSHSKVRCDFQPFAALADVSDARRCLRCGFVDRTGQTTRDCDLQPPSLTERTGTYARAVRKWRSAGQPRRTQGEILDIYHNCCRPCKQFDKTKGTCTICGCYVGQGTQALLNKIAMATEACPAIPPKWTAAVAISGITDKAAFHGGQCSQ